MAPRTASGKGVGPGIINWVGVFILVILYDKHSQFRAASGFFTVWNPRESAVRRAQAIVSQSRQPRQMIPVSPLHNIPSRAGTPSRSLAVRFSATPDAADARLKSNAEERRNRQLELLRTAPFEPGSLNWLREMNISEQTARTLLEKAFEQALLSDRMPGRFEGHAFGASAVASLSADSHRKATQTLIVSDRNLPNRQDNFFCAERAVLKQVENHAIEHKAMSMDHGSVDVPRIQALAVVNADFQSPDILNASPCLYCLQAFQTSGGLMGEKSMILTFGRDSRGELTINARPLQTFLPMMGRQRPSYTTLPIESLPVELSPEASRLLQSHHIELTPSLVRATLKAAKSAYEDAVKYHRSTRNGLASGASLLLQTPQGRWRIASGCSLHPKNGYFTACDMDAASQALRPWPLKRWRRRARQAIKAISALIDRMSKIPGFSRIKKAQELTFRAQRALSTLDFAMAPPAAAADEKPLKGLTLVAYFSKLRNDLPRPESFGALSQLAGAQTFLAAVIEPDETGSPRIQVRAFQNYLPILYLKRSHLEAESQESASGTSKARTL